MNWRRHAVRGFTLMELLIIVTIIGILAAIAYPNYTEYVARGRRAEAKAAMLNAMQALERHYGQFNTYADSADPTKGWQGFPLQSDSNLYTLSALACGALSFNECVQVNAVPRLTDATCGTLLLRSTGEQGILVNNASSFTNLPQACR
ncbi:type IV pilin protein [Cupriavidus basilensis]